MEVSGRPRVGVSSCLLGETVRWDGGHKRDADLIEWLGRDVDWVPVCPEVEMGLGTPREPINLVRTHGDTKLVTTTTARDLTDVMRRYATARVAALAHDLPVEDDRRLKDPRVLDDFLARVRAFHRAHDV